MPSNLSAKQRINSRKLIRNLIIELLVYGILVAIYALLVLRWLGEPMRILFHKNLTFYSLAALALIVAQAVLLERLTSFLMARLGMQHFE